MTTVLIVDDQALVRVGLRKVFETEREIAVVGEAGDGENAVTCARRLHPDVVLMDIRMPVLDGIEATRRIVRAQPTTRVLILTTFGSTPTSTRPSARGQRVHAQRRTPRRHRSTRQDRRERRRAACSRGHACRRRSVHLADLPFRACSGVMNRWYAGVSTNASAMVLTRMLAGASSIARFLVRAWRPAGAAE